MIYKYIYIYIYIYIYLPGFLKRWLLKICPFWPERRRNRVFWTPMSLETTRERKEKVGERGEKKKGLLALIIFILPTLEIVSERPKSARDTPLGHLNRAVPFSKIRVYIYIYIYIYFFSCCFLLGLVFQRKIKLT